MPKIKVIAKLKKAKIKSFVQRFILKGSEIIYGVDSSGKDIKFTTKAIVDLVPDKSKFKGVFPDLTALKTDLPEGTGHTWHNNEGGWYADVDLGVGSDTQRYIWDKSDLIWVASGSGTPLTAEQIKNLYESNPDTNAYTDNDKSKVFNAITVETDPTVPNHVKGITQQDINDWDSKLDTETDPTVPNHVKNISQNDIIGWNNKLDSETDPTVPAHVKSITSQNITDWNEKQEPLVSGTNIKTINGNSILGSGDLDLSENIEVDTTNDATKTISDTTNLYVINPASLAASMTRQLPANPSEGQILRIKFGGEIETGTVVTAFTLTCDEEHEIVLNPAATAIEMGVEDVFVFQFFSNVWYRIDKDGNSGNDGDDIYYATATGTNNYSVTIPGISSYESGLAVNVKFTNGNTGACTLNINSLGAKDIVRNGNVPMVSGIISAGGVFLLVYDGAQFHITAYEELPTYSGVGEKAISITSAGIHATYDIVPTIPASVADLQNASWINDTTTGITGYQGQVASDSNYIYVCTNDNGSWSRFKLGFPTVNTGEKVLTITPAGVQKNYDVVQAGATNVSDLQSATWSENRCSGVTGYVTQVATDANWIYVCYDDSGKWVRIPQIISEVVELRLPDFDDSSGIPTSGELDTAYPSAKAGQQAKGATDKIYQKEGAGDWIYFEFTNC